MNRKEAAKLLPIIEAFSEGKTLQIRQNGSEWIDIETASFTGFPSEYRIKPEPKYRPFEDKEECWQEMFKHQPFGWVKNKNTQSFFLCKAVGSFVSVGTENSVYTYGEAFGFFTFTDGHPFGVKEE